MEALRDGLVVRGCGRVARGVVAMTRLRAFKVTIDNRDDDLTRKAPRLYVDRRGREHSFPVELYVGDRSFHENGHWYRVLCRVS
jgi:hypothetical protein